MKKIEIITLHYIDNYGSVLQTLATQLIFENKGCKAEIIDYVRNNCSYDSLLKGAKERYNKKLPRLIAPIATPFLLQRWKINYKKRNIIFSDFRREYLCLTRKYNNQKDLYNNPPDADIYCTGSDQVWNTEYNGGLLREYYLAFAPDNKPKISLSSSFGFQGENFEYREEIRELLLHYKMISVREESALDLVNSLGCKDAIHVIDPTLAISKKGWEKRLSLKPVLQKKYVLVYQLNDSKKMLDFSKKLADKYNFQLVLISTNYKARFYTKNVFSCPTVIEFLSLIDFAEFVVTDSFHGTAFSLNFNKEFFINYPNKYSTRLESILKKTLTLDRLIDKVINDNFSFNKIDYESVNAVLEEERKKINEFVESAIKDE